MTEFKDVKLGDLFRIEKITGFNKNELKINPQGKYDYITRTSQNNGIESVTDKVPNRIINEPNTFSLGLLQMTFFYRDRPWYAGQFVRKITPKFQGNEAVYLYMLVCLRKVSKILLGVLVRDVDDTFNNLTIKVPVEPKNNKKLDFQYMENLMKTLEQDRVKALDDYLTVTKLDNYQLNSEDKEVLARSVHFSEFKIGDIFEIHKGKRLTKADQIKGNTLFIGSTASNHGETARIGQKPIFKPNTITVCYNGSVGETFYQDKPYWASDDINVLTLKNFKLDAEIAEYLCAVIKKAGKQYGYAYKWNVSRMKESIISLPVDNDNSIDFEYMKKYIRAIQKTIVKDVVKYRDEMITNVHKK